VSLGVVTDGVTLFFRCQKSDDLSLVIVLKSDDLFLVTVTTPTLSAFQISLSPVLFVNSAAKNFRLSSGCHPLDGVTWGVLPPIRPQ